MGVETPDLWAPFPLGEAVSRGSPGVMGGLCLLLVARVQL